METRSWNDNIINAFVSELQQPPWSVIDSFTDVNDLFCSGVAVYEFARQAPKPSDPKLLI